MQLRISVDKSAVIMTKLSIFCPTCANYATILMFRTAHPTLPDGEFSAG